MSHSSGPLSHWLQNQSLVRFSSGTTELEQVAYSNTVVTPWVGPRLEVKKGCNVPVAALGQSLIYLIEIMNTGNRTAIVNVVDALSEETSLLPNSVLLDGIPLPGASPERGLPPAEVAPGATLRYHFQVVIVHLPPALKLLNQALVNYEFITPEGRTVTGRELSNTVEVTLTSSRLEVALQTDHILTFSGDIVMYSIVVNNPGFLIATGTRVTVALSPGLVFIPASVIVNGMFAPQMTPDSGIEIGDIEPGSSVRIQYRVQVVAVRDAESIPTQAVLEYISAGGEETVYSNEVTLEVIQPLISIYKRVLPVNASAGDIVRYDITISNESNYAVDAKVSDSLPAGMTFVEGSLGWNGVKRPGANPVKGFNLGTLTARSVINIQFEAKIAEQGAVQPNHFELVNQARLLYTYRLPDSRTVQRMAVSNEATVYLKSPIIKVYVEVIPVLIEQGGSVTFQVRVENTGSLSARVQLAGVLPPGAKWRGQAEGQVQWSIPQYSTPRYLHLGELGPGAERNISYVAQLSPEETGTLKGFLTALFTYEINGQKRSGEARSNEYSIVIEYGEE
ncbi:hypothetical protein [Paenibacillus xylanilyticus]|uniref:hypothetical protein n=1 Tax=Paenibacillus xylanilyticus TaxID=248903 RepID=UPI0039A02B09